MVPDRTWTLNPPPEAQGKKKKLVSPKMAFDKEGKKIIFSKIVKVLHLCSRLQDRKASMIQMCCVPKFNGFLKGDIHFDLNSPLAFMTHSFYLKTDLELDVR